MAICDTWYMEFNDQITLSNILCAYVHLSEVDSWFDQFCRYTCGRFGSLLHIISAEWFPPPFCLPFAILFYQFTDSCEFTSQHPHPQTHNHSRNSSVILPWCGALMNTTMRFPSCVDVIVLIVMVFVIQIVARILRIFFPYKFWLKASRIQNGVIKTGTEL